MVETILTQVMHGKDKKPGADADSSTVRGRLLYLIQGNNFLPDCKQLRFLDLHGLLLGL